MAAAAVISAGMLGAMIMMAATGRGIINKISAEESVYHIIGFASYAAHDNNTGLVQCHPGTAADTATDQQVYILLGKQTCLCTVTASVCVQNFLAKDLPCLDFINLKSRCVAKMLIHQAVCVSDCDFHIFTSFSYFISRHTSSV